MVAPDHDTLVRLKEACHFFNEQAIPILPFPGWETLPYDHFSSHPDIISQRLTTLYQLPTFKKGMVITTIDAIMHRLPPRDFLQRHSLLLKIGDTCHIDSFRNQLIHAGYRLVNQVYEHGEFASRGSIIDIFPSGCPHPFRIDLLDDEVETIRTFLPETQRTLEKIEHIQVLPAKEFPFTIEAIEGFRQSWRNHFGGNPLLCPLYQDISEGKYAPGIEYYLPLFFAEMSTIFDYLPSEMEIAWVGNAQPKAQEFWKNVEARYEAGRHDYTRPLLAPEKLFLTPEQLTSSSHVLKVPSSRGPEPVEGSAGSTVNAVGSVDPADPSTGSGPRDDGYGVRNDSRDNTISPLPKLHIDQNTGALTLLQQFTQIHPGRILFSAESEGRQEMLRRLLQNIALSPTHFDTWHDFLAHDDPYGIVLSPLEEGFILEKPNIAFIPELALHEEQVMQRRRRARSVISQNNESLILNLNELKINDLIVHIDHGIGRYQGLETLTVGNERAEYMLLVYQDGDKLFVPVTSLHLINRYTGADPEQVALSKLGNEQWKKAKKQALKNVRDVAAELLHLYAKRAARKGHSFTINSDHYTRFATQFPFEETPDQTAAIEHVLKDMATDQSMDRVICGDVGFGKTEVAMRAAFVAVDNHKQVIVLVPTTLLAQQHFESFQNRFAHWPVQIAMVSRFVSTKEQEKILKNVEAGKIDILIGTHKLLQPNIKFKALGLVIVDEEHRFGVKQKEKIKTLHHQVDMLTLTATPIPRTLNMALSGIRDLSIIATPPAKRLAVKTFLHEYQNAIIQEALQRELFRGGQVYFLHNDIETIQKQADHLAALVPHARIGIAHGQMPERQLEKVMSEFYHRHFNVLVCSTIIESGIDVPTANTIIINRADHFGIAQLHQLRGRVGRSHHQAYAYLLIPNQKQMTADAVKRLEAITAYDHLGIGFTLSTHDLEIRGAGELLGEKQSGNIKEIGYTLYMDLLSRAIESIKAGKDPSTEDVLLTPATEVNVHLTTLIPETYLPDVELRLQFYKRIATAKNVSELNDLQVEMIDRFGLLPIELKHLFSISELKLKMIAIGITKLDVGETKGQMTFSEKPAIKPETLIALIRQKDGRFRMQGLLQLQFAMDPHPATERINLVEALLSKLTA